MINDFGRLTKSHSSCLTKNRSKRHINFHCNDNDKVTNYLKMKKDIDRRFVDKTEPLETLHQFTNTVTIPLSNVNRKQTQNKYMILSISSVCADDEYKQELHHKQKFTRKLTIFRRCCYHVQLVDIRKTRGRLKLWIKPNSLKRNKVCLHMCQVEVHAKLRIKTFLQVKRHLNFKLLLKLLTNSSWYVWKQDY